MEPKYAFPRNSVSVQYPDSYLAYFQDDGIWFLSCSFGIWTMVSGMFWCIKNYNFFIGFGLLESGRVSSKDEVNIMVKNVVDVVFGGFSYWAFGFGFTFGDRFPNPFIGNFFITY